MRCTYKLCEQKKQLQESDDLPLSRLQFVMKMTRNENNVNPKPWNNPPSIFGTIIIFTDIKM